MRVSSSVSFLATAGSTLLLSSLFAEAADVPTVCNSPAKPVELVSETNAPLRLRCGKNFPELVPLDGRAFAVDADGSCGATLVDADLVQVALRPLPASEPANDPKGYLVSFTKNAVEKDTKICFRCAPSTEPSPKPPAAGSAASQDSCVIFVTLKTAHGAVAAAPVEPGSSAINADPTGTSAQKEETEELGSADASEEPEATNSPAAGVSAPGVEVRRPKDGEDATPMEAKETVPRVSVAPICSEKQHKVTVAPKEQTTFGCGPSMALEPADRTTVFLAGNDEQCGGEPVVLSTALPGSQLTAENISGQEIFTFTAGALPADESRHFCYLCSSTEASETKAQCKMLVTVTSAASSFAVSLAKLGAATIFATVLSLAF
ncbi:SAG-related sequence SRS46 [Toxoplasma gondii VAND]|uniref:SRS46 n=5 Tax=Toxoplasma gondii TaxID=5811 RepID=B9QNC9_TOXGV|nr:SAG-related sequence SRS46 [Toxoplasma gondii VEG]KFG44403.1 SAG-related sequence SRS46 [Toxoplasma gondii FOU]KFH07714.1 SAG-related sequence SRS46 [Toxoplasma gondii VAND]PUA86516.1 SAG-related sequence SRS46 [Toxoplasma gondii TgCATBr9]RQX70030.1 SAG-related sequence SRS46 [Toxoplasma gondii CAST]